MSARIPYTPPTYNATGFNCVHCHAYADQTWGMPILVAGGSNYGSDARFSVCRCGRCEEFSYWIDEKMVYPPETTAAPPNSDLPDGIKVDFEEARSIVAKSPRGAAALLRLVIQKLCKTLGQPGKDINCDIGKLVQNGLPQQVQESLDIVRVVGNNAVHPGQLDLIDDSDVAHKLFELVNIIADIMITQPKRVKDLFESVVPEPQKDAIKKRDGT